MLPPKFSVTGTQPNIHSGRFSFFNNENLLIFQEPDETIKHNDDNIEESDDDADDALLEDVINLARQPNPRYFYILL